MCHESKKKPIGQGPLPKKQAFGYVVHELRDHHVCRKMNHIKEDVVSIRKRNS